MSRILSLCIACFLWMSHPVGAGVPLLSAPTLQAPIPPQPLATAIQAWARESGVQVMYATQLAKGRQSQGAPAGLAPTEALARILQGTGLGYRILNDRTVSLLSQTADTAAAAEELVELRLAVAQSAAEGTVRGSSEQPPAQSPPGAGATPEILVKGSKILNMDIRRSRDDAQPYMIFDREQLQRSGSPNLEDFFKTRLTSNVTGATNATGAPGRGLSLINLRGFGTDQTLILVDGRRVPTPAIGGLPLQPDVNMIPMGAIERVEVLPTTSSGIYGGSATGGVINIILRRDFTGMETRLTYDNTFHSDSASKRAEFSAGYTLGEGRTNILVGGSFSEANTLASHDRSLYQDGVAHIRANNFAHLVASSVPPLGATPNIRSTTGANLVLKNGNVPLNSPITFVPIGYAGPASDNGAALAINAGKYNQAWADSAQAQGGKDYSISYGGRVESFIGMVRHQLSPSLQTYVDMAFSNTRDKRRDSGFGFFSLPASAPNNPFQQAIYVRVPTGEVDIHTGPYNQNRKLAVGAILRLPHQWTSALDVTVGRTSMLVYNGPSETPATSSEVSAGTPNILRDPAYYPYGFTLPQFLPPYYDKPSKSKLFDTSLRFAGPVFKLPAGDAVLSSLLEFRKDEFGDQSFFLNGGWVYYPTRAQKVSSGYTELFMPLVSAAQSVPLVHDLSLQLAVRYDRNVVGGGNTALRGNAAIERTTNRTSSANPTLALRYQPVEDLIVRASYGTGFLAPSVFRLGPLLSFPATGPVDPRRGNVAGGSYTLVGGGNPNLKPELSTTWSGGIVFTPQFLSGLRLSVDYTSIEKKDNIVTLTSAVILANESLFPDRVVRGPLLPGDPYSVGPITYLDASAVNVARARLNAWDLSAEYTFNTANAGAFTVSSGMTITDRYETQLLPTSPWLNAVGIENFFVTVQQPGITLKYRGNLNLQWRKGPLNLGWFTGYFHSYYPGEPSTPSNANLLLAQGGNGKVHSQIFHDVSFGYDFDRGAGGQSTWADGLSLSGGVRNVFNKKPAIDIGNALLYASAFGDPRLSSYFLSLTKRF